MKCAHPGRSLLATAMATPPHPAPLEKLRTACLLMGFSLARSPVSRCQGGGSSKGREPGSQGQTSPSLPGALFPGGFKGPFHLKDVPSSHTPGERNRSRVPCMLYPHFLLRKLEVLDSVFLLLFLSSCPRSPLQGLLYLRKAAINSGLKLLSPLSSFPLF